MTRLTFGVSGNPLTFRPVTSSITRTTDAGDINIIILLLGTDYNIKMTGILQHTTTGDIDDTYDDIKVEDGYLHIQAKRLTNQPETAENIGTFSSFMYFMPGFNVVGNLRLDESSTPNSLTEYIGGYKFVDLLTKDEIRFEISRGIANNTVNFIERVSGVDTVIYTEELGVGIKEYDFKFQYLKQGKSIFKKIENYKTETETATQVWKGDITAKVGECRVSTYCRNESTDSLDFSSDYMLINYPNISIRYDEVVENRFNGRIKMYDDNNLNDEESWTRIRSRDYSFTGNRVIQNGLIRIIIKSIKPEIDIYGWNLELEAWEKSHTMMVDSDAGDKSIAIQNISIEYFNSAQLRMVCSFGTSVYKLAITRGDPYVALNTITNSKLRIKSQANRMGADFKSGTTLAENYTLTKTGTKGSPVVRDASVETLDDFTLLDNYFGFYNNDSLNEICGFMANAVNPTEIEIKIIGDDIIYTFTYPMTGNIFGLGVLESNPSNLSGTTPLPFVIGKQDKYIKWRANESLFVFKEIDTFRRR